MNYRHIYHAGNFADVFKHLIVLFLVQSLARKEAPFFCLDTHAGTGCYDLFSDQTQKSKEYEDGIGKLFAQFHSLPLINDYLESVKKLNSNEELRYYPGSPVFVRDYLRAQDRMVLSELHPQDVRSLKKYFARDKQVHVHEQDGYISLRALIPPKERRGLVLIDPPYEEHDECINLPMILKDALKRWETGIYAVWYPIKNYSTIKRFYDELKNSIKRPILVAEFYIYPIGHTTSLPGCGMVIVNPPWKAEQEVGQLLPYLSKRLGVNHTQFYFTYLIK